MNLFSRITISISFRQNITGDNITREKKSLKKTKIVKRPR